jgi:hypothetical protein
MATITIAPDNSQTSPTTFRAVAGDVQSVGETIGQALDALTEKLGEPQETTLIVVQPMRPDAFFTAVQRQRLAELMDRWRAARDAGTSLPAQEQAELDSLVEAELRAASERSAALARQIAP